MKENNRTTNTVDLGNLFKIFLKRKWWALGAFIVILTIGLLITFLKTPQYMISETIKVTDNYIYYNDLIYKYFPEESEDLWLAPEGQEFTFEKKSLVYIINEVQSDIFLNSLHSVLDNRFSTGEIRDLLDMELSEKLRQITLTIVHNDPIEGLQIIKATNLLLKDTVKGRLEPIREDIVNKLEQKIFNLENEINEIIESNSEDKNPLVEREIDEKYTNYYNLKEINDILIKNKELITDRVEIVREPGSSDIIKITNVKRDILFSIFAAFIISIMTVLISNYFLEYARRDE